MVLARDLLRFQLKRWPGLERGGKVHFQGWQEEHGFTPLHLGLCAGCWCVLKARLLDSPRGARWRRARGGVAMPPGTGFQSPAVGSTPFSLLEVSR